MAKITYHNYAITVLCEDDTKCAADMQGDTRHSVKYWDFRYGSRPCYPYKALGIGEGFRHILEVELQHEGWDYIGIWPHDIVATEDDARKLIALARSQGLGAVAPSFSSDSLISYEFMRHRPSGYYREAKWVEWGGCYFKRSVAAALLEYLPLSISGWGIDCWALPQVLAEQGLKAAVCDAVQVYHPGPARSQEVLYNGLTCRQECDRVLAKVREKQGGVTT